MLNNLKNAGNLINNANQVRQQQAKLQKLLSEIRVTGTSKNGRVTVVITGEQKIVDISIDPGLIKFVYENFTSANKPDTMLSKAIIEAVDDAIAKVQGEVVKKMQETGSLGDLMSMLQVASNSGQPGAQ
jgi:DNA-binding YbaB/EbfC family protein